MNSSKLSFAALVLFSGIFLRGLFLEYTDLIDPTEARYAIVAQEMLLTNDWLTPKLPMPEGVMPYLGKPPLHFWATALSYKIFGFEEWSARFPSFLATCLILFAIFKFAEQFFNRQIALVSTLIALSSGMMFFLAGASVTDVTLTAMITVATTSLYSYISAPTKNTFLLAVVFSGLAFLCKGPVAIALIALPFLLWSAAIHDFNWVKSFPWIRATLIFSALVLPWFIASEIENPGFIKYFIWNENIARYLFKEYGDLYGTGHVHTYGMSWLMLFAAFMPWSAVLLIGLCLNRIKNSWSWLTSDRTILFVFSWGVSAGLFFTFVRQLHGMYLLPSIPALALLTAKLICVTEGKVISTLNQLSRFFIMLTWLLLIVLGALLHFYSLSFIIGIVLFSFGATLIYRRSKNNEEFVGLIAATLICTYLLVITSITPYINLRRSSEEALKYVVSQISERDPIQQIGIFTRNNYSHYWTANAWENELGKKIKIHYLSSEEKIPLKMKYLLIKSDKKKHDIRRFFNNIPFNIAFHSGEWWLYKRDEDV